MVGLLFQEASPNPFPSPPIYTNERRLAATAAGLAGKSDEFRAIGG